MPLIIPANSITGGYEVDNSLRFDDGSSDSLSHTQSTPTNADKITFSFWVKLADTLTGGGDRTIIGERTDANNQSYLYFRNDQTLGFYQVQSGSANFDFRSTRVFRDQSAWYNIVVLFDTAQATSTNRFKIYVNNEEITNWNANTYPSQNDNVRLNGATETLKIGGDLNQTDCSFYLAEFVYCDGQALDPTSFGEFDEDSGIWKPIDVSGLTFGTNGFYLDFENSGSLGADVSGNGNNFTVNNLTSIDQTTDTPTNNFATLNPLQTDHSGNTAFSEGNNKFQATTTDWVGTASTQGTNTGKWYAEFKLSTLTTAAMIGIATDVYLSDRGVTDYVGFTSGLSNYAYAKYLTGGVDANEGKIRDQSETYNSYGSNTGGSTEDIIGVALDLDNNKVYWSVNGTWENSGDPASNSNGYTIGAGTYQFGVWGYQATSESNFGNPPFTISSGNTDGNGYGNFEYAVPSVDIMHLTQKT
jgi:hypothetical protein